MLFDAADYQGQFCSTQVKATSCRHSFGANWYKQRSTCRATGAYRANYRTKLI